MNVYQIKKYYIGKENVPTPITDSLIEAGYKQKQGGYITYAKQCGVVPTQYWHLMKSYCARSKDNTEFTHTIQCGELLVWMAEVSGAVSSEELQKLRDTVVSKYLNNRRVGNRIIQNVVFDKIVREVEHI